MCLGSGAAFGAMAIFGKLAYGEGATVGTLLAVRFVLAAALFWALVLAGGGAREVAALGRRDIAIGLASARAATRSRPGCYFAALERIDASLLSLLLYTFPAIVAVAAVALGRERIDRRRVAALGLAFGGLVLVLAGAGRGRARPAGRRARARRRGRLQHLHPRQRRHRRTRAAAGALGTRVHRRGGVPDRRLGAARRVASWRADAGRLGLAGLPRRRLDGRRDQPLLRRPRARGSHDRLDPLHRRAAGHGPARLPRLR